jgi:CTP:molybdopterin cytidylyltransferase MocA
MNFPKALLKLNEKTFLSLICEKLREVCGEILIVLGWQAEKIMSQINIEGAKIIKNENFEKGMFSSLKTALRNINPENEGFFLNPVDCPLIERKTYRQIAEYWLKNKDKIVIPVHKGKRGHPPIFPWWSVSEILRLPDEVDGGVKSFLTQHQDKILLFETQDKGVIIDVDTPQEYLRMLKIEDRG